MNNIASLRRTEPAAAERFSVPKLAMVLASLMLTVVIMSFRPFQPAGAGSVDEMASAGGDIVNQLGFGSLGALAIFSMLCFVDRRVLAALLSPWWLLVLAFLFLSVMNAMDPASAMRAVSFTLIGIATMAAVLTLPRDADSFSTALAFAGFVIIALSMAGLVLFPNEAMHSAASFEPQHAGLWRGVFAHKNIAGPVMACFSFAGIYLFRRGWRRRGAVLFAAAMLFMLHTGSKTTAGLVPLSTLIVILPGMIGLRLVTPILFTMAVAGTALATLGIVFIDPLKDLAAALAPDLTYTGRTSLWHFSGEMIAQRPWTGYGYESFWGTPVVTGAEQPFDREWDIRGIVHGHNGYLDIAILMGLPALGIAVFTFLIEPLRDYMRIPLRRENVYLGDLFMMIVLFAALNAFLESFFFRRADPVWLLFVFGILGLRLAARFPVATKRVG